MVQMKALDKRRLASAAIEEMSRKIDGFQEEFLQGIASSIVLDSPVDTGTYMESHNIGISPEGGFNSSRGKPKGQPYGVYAQPTLNRLFSEIELFANTDIDKIYIYNTAEHAINVEYEHGYEVYSRAKNKAEQIAEEAAAKVRARDK
jgi:hypothetical protein